MTVPVATRAHLIALKVLARDDRDRPQDLDDIRALLTEATEREVSDAHQALRLIEARGYGRGRSLTEDLQRIIANTRS
jgi:hypothetical protein